MSVRQPDIAGYLLNSQSLLRADVKFCRWVNAQNVIIFFRFYFQPLSIRLMYQVFLQSCKPMAGNIGPLGQEVRIP